MKVRTYIGILLGVGLLVWVAWLTVLNSELLSDPAHRFQLGAGFHVSFVVIAVVVFLAGFLPPATMLLVRSLKRDLDERRERRRSREAISLEKSLRRAIDYHADGQWSKAAAELEAVLTERPEEFMGLLLQGEVLRQQGRASEAVEVHRRASVLYPRSIALLYQMAEDYDAHGEEQVAREIRNRVLRDFPGQGLRIMRRRRDSHLAERDWEEALRWHEKIEALVEDRVSSGSPQGDRVSPPGSPEGASEREREAGVSLGLTYQRAMTLLEKDRPAEAAQIFRRLLEQEPRFIPAGIMLGEAELYQGNEEHALDEWKRGFTSTGSPVFLQRIEDYFIDAAEPARAIETLRGLIARAENDLLPRFFLGRLYYRLEMHPEAMKMLGSIAERMDSSPTFQYLLARIAQRSGDAPAALSRYHQCVQRLGVPSTTYVCGSCRAKYSEWHDRCEACGTWNSVDFDIQEEKLSEEELGLVDRPVWGGYRSQEDTQTVEIQK